MTFSWSAVRHRLFTLGVLAKGVDGLLEIVGGFLLLLSRHEQISAWIFAVTRQEVAEDPHDLVANFLRHGVAHLSSDTQIFAAAYLLGHGAIKITLVIGLLTDERWSYPTALTVLGAFIFYQLYRLSYSHSVWLAALSVVDMIVVMLIYAEYRSIRHGDPTGARTKGQRSRSGRGPKIRHT